MDRSLCVLAACLAVAAAFAGCAASGAPFDPIPTADWKPGYAFGYTTELTGTGDVRVEVDGEVQEQDDSPFHGMPSGQRPTQSYRVLDATTIDGVPVYLALDNHRRVLAFRQTDLQPLSTSIHQTNGKVTQMSVEPVLDDHPWLRFPLERGDTWSSELRDFDSPVGFDMSVVVESTVYGMESVEGPNGPVDAVRIEHDFVFDEEAIEDMMLAGAAEAGVDVRSFSFDISALRVIHYAPSLHNIVRDEIEVSNSVYARFTEGGKDIEVDAEMEFVGIMRLAQATLEEKPATPLSKLDSVKTPRLPQVVAADGQPAVLLDVKTSAAWVNAAQSPTVRVTADAVGVSNVVLQLVDATGRFVEQDKGTSAEWTVSEPGRYRVVAYGRATDGYSVQAETDLVAGYEATVPAGCFLVTMPFVGCDTTAVPVRPGLLSLEVSAVRQPLAVEDGMGTLRLWTYGDVLEADMEGNQATIRMDDFDMADHYAYEDWEAQYEPTVGVAEDVEYRIVLDYGQPEDVEAASADLARLLLSQSAETLARPWARPLLPG